MLGLGSSLALGGAPSEFVLTNISGLDIWLQYDTGFTADGSDAISQWDDQSGNDNHAVQATTDFKPTLVSGAASFADANRDTLLREADPAVIVKVAGAINNASTQLDGKNIAKE